MVFDLRIDIEKVEPNGDCSRPVTDTLLCESQQSDIIEEHWATLRRLFPCIDTSGVKVENKAVYTVIVWKIDEEESDDFYEEIALARFTSLKNAKKLMNEVVECNL